MKYLNETGVNKLISLIKTALKGKAEAEHDHANYVKYNSNTTISSISTTINANTLEGHSASDFLPQSGGTMTGALVAQNNTNYTVAQVHNIIFSSADPTNTDGANGDIWLKYSID